MKKMLFTLLAAGFIATAGFAQPPSTTAPLSKEEKAAMKAKSEADLKASFTEAGIDAKSEEKVREIMAEASAKSKELKENDKLTQEEKDAAKQLINDEKNGKIKEVLGADVYKTWTTIRKKQKEAAGAK